MSKFPKYTLQVAVNTLCRHEKVTTWYELAESAFVPPNGYQIVKECFDADDWSVSVRTGLLACWMRRDGVFNPDLIDILLPPVGTLYKGLGAIAAVVQKEEGGPIEPYSSLSFEFDQQVGGPVRIKFDTIKFGDEIMKMPDDIVTEAAAGNADTTAPARPVIREEAGPTIHHRALYAGLKQFYAQVGQYPLITFDVTTGNDPYKLHGKDFYFTAEDQDEVDGIPAKSVIRVGQDVGDTQLEIFTFEFPRDEEEDMGCSWDGSDHWDASYMEDDYVTQVMGSVHNFIYAYQNGNLPGVPAPEPESFASSTAESPLAEKFNAVVKGNDTKH